MFADEHCVYDPLSQRRQCHGCVHVVMYKLPSPSPQHLPACSVHRLCLNIFLLLIFRNQTCSGIPSRGHQTSSTICCIFYGLGQMVIGARAGLDRSQPDSSTCGGHCCAALTELALIMKNNHKSECLVVLQSRNLPRWRTMGSWCKK